MTGFIYNNKSYTVGYGTGSIEYTNNGSNTIGYSMYGENVPVEPVEPLLYIPLRSITLPGTCWVDTDVTVDLTDSYLPTFELKLKPGTNSSEVIFAAFDNNPSFIRYNIYQAAGLTQTYHNYSAAWQSDGYGTDNLLSTSGTEAFYNREQSAFYVVCNNQRIVNGYSLDSLQTTGYAISKKPRNNAVGTLKLFRPSWANTTNLSTATIYYIKLTLKDGTHYFRPYLNSATKQVVIKDELTSTYYDFSGDTTGITYVPEEPESK